MPKLTIFSLRRGRSFNKSRYARNRQLARVIFYIALYINVLITFGIFSLFYNIIFKFSIWWWSMYVFLGLLVITSLRRIMRRR